MGILGTRGKCRGAGVHPGLDVEKAEEKAMRGLAWRRSGETPGTPTWAEAATGDLP